MFLLFSMFWLFDSCVITTHSVKEIDTSEMAQPDALSEYTSFKFSSAVKPQKTKDWFRNYFGLDRKDDLVNFKSSFLEDSNHEFIITISDYSDKEEYMDLTGLFFGGGVKNRVGDLKFFIEITITDKSGVDHLAEDSIFQKPILEKLSEMRNEFQSFTGSNPDQKFF
ncbi:hypothetical protein SAMN05660903_00367 [Salegentibacter salinarum]|nr:hypothetical protein [Salegentibacter salinarum]SKB36186.1 hypothetical protein SAMN05660903_00367 [Salegentibacter salinarum]